MYDLQALIRWLGAHYASYDEFSFWRTESRRDHSKLLEQMEHLQHQVNSLSSKVGPSSPLSTPTRLIDDVQSPEIISRTARASERMARGASMHTQGMRRAPRKDLEEFFNDCDDAVPTTQILPSRVPRGSKSPATLSPASREPRFPRGTKSPRTTSHARRDNRLASRSKSPGTLARGPKTTRQGHAPQRDTAMTQSTLEGSVKKAKAKDGGEGKLAASNGFSSFYYKHAVCIGNDISSECMHPKLDVHSQ